MSSNFVVLKFGGTSVSSAATWKQIMHRSTGIVKEEGARVWIVVSALSKVTDNLAAALSEAVARVDDEEFESVSFDWIAARHKQLADEVGLSAVPQEVDRLLQQLKRLLQGVHLTGEVNARLRARVMAYGELMSVAMGKAIFELFNHPLVTVDLADVLKGTDVPMAAEEDRYLEARVIPVEDIPLLEKVSQGASIILSPGFRCRTSTGEIAILGRGGSDTSAVLVGAMARAIRVEIWTDVHGIFSADPRKVPEARLIEKIGNREAQELASMGAKVLHPRCLAPAKQMNLLVQVRNTMDPTGPITAIVNEETEQNLIYGVTSLQNTTLISLSSLEMWGASGFLAKFFAPFEKLGISVDQVATSQSSVSVTLDHIPGGVEGPAFARLKEALAPLGQVTVVHPCTVVSIVGNRIRNTLHEFESAFGCFGDVKVLLVSASSDGVALSFVVPSEEAASLAKNLHSKLISSASTDVFGPSWDELQAKKAAAAK